MGLAGTGISYTQQSQQQGEQSNAPAARDSNLGCLLVLLVGAILIAAIAKASR